MIQASQVFKTTKTVDENISALSWNIATEPKLYRELAPNPFSPKATQIISEKFPGLNAAYVIRAIVLAEQEGKYERIFKQLPQELQKEELNKQTNVTAEITKRLNEFHSQHAQRFWELPQDLKYDIFFKIAFETTNSGEAELRYGQNQRICIKLLILNLIGKQENRRLLLIEQALSYGNSVNKASKTFPRTALVVFFLISFFFLAFIFFDKQIAQGQKEDLILTQKTIEQLQSIDTKEESQGLPIHLKIPNINVDSAVEYVGLASKGTMGVPNNAVNVGWFKFGSRPGEKGSAVIAGHFNKENGEAGVFFDLYKLKKGDKLYITDDKGVSIIFVVRESRIYDPGWADEVFSKNDGTYLNLVTCDGVWDGVKKTYSKRLVVFADIAK